MAKLTTQIYHDHFQNYKRYNIPKAQLVIADIPYNVGKNAYGSNPAWYIDGDNANGQSALAGTEFFDTDKDFRIAEFMHFCSKMMKKEPKERNQAPCMIVFCEFWHQMQLRDLAKQYGINGCINIVFRKNFSAQVLKANMRIVGNAEYALLLYRDKLPKFKNDGRMVFNIQDWTKDPKNDLIRKIHPTQKPVAVLERLIRYFTDPGDIVNDPCSGSGSTLIACQNTGRVGIGFEIKKNFYEESKAWVDFNGRVLDDLHEKGYSHELLKAQYPNQEPLF